MQERDLLCQNGGNKPGNQWGHWDDSTRSRVNFVGSWHIYPTPPTVSQGCYQKKQICISTFRVLSFHNSYCDAFNCIWAYSYFGVRDVLSSLLRSLYSSKRWFQWAVTGFTNPLIILGIQPLGLTCSSNQGKLCMCWVCIQLWVRAVLFNWVHKPRVATQI